MASVPDDSTPNYFMPNYSANRTNAGEPQEDGWQTGWKVMKMAFIPEKIGRAHV